MKTHAEELPGESRPARRSRCPLHDVDHAFEHALNDLRPSRRGCPASARARRRGPGRQRIGDDVMPRRGARQSTSPAGTSGPSPWPGSTRSTARPSTGRRARRGRDVRVQRRGRGQAAARGEAYKGLEGVRFPRRGAPARRSTASSSGCACPWPSWSRSSAARRRATSWSSTSRAAIDGTEIEGGTASTTASSSAPAGCCPISSAASTGMKAGEERDVTVLFPADYGAEHLAGKAAHLPRHVEGGQGAACCPSSTTSSRRASASSTRSPSCAADIDQRIGERVEAESDQRFRPTVLDALAASWRPRARGARRAAACRA